MRKWEFVQAEARGFIILAAISILGIVLPFYFDKNLGGEYAKIDHVEVVDSVRAEAIEKDFEHVKENSKAKAIDYFEFNPNSASINDFVNLGLPKYLAERIDKYRSKGGKFRKPTDFSKIYGLKPDIYQKLEPYIKISQPEAAVSTKYEKLAEKKEEVAFEKPKSKPRVIAPFDINKADTSQLIAINGVGAFSAKKIINFRNALGGFVTLEQIGETKNIHPSVLESLLPLLIISSPPKKISINQSTEFELDKHPYISKKHAEVIIAYRTQHGNFHSKEDLLKIKIIDEKTISRMLPYLSFN